MDRYQKVKKIGEGSFGKAYLVKSKRDGQQYVIKEINITRMARKEREEARKEVALLAQMKHPNIVTYRESFEETGSLFICMDFCDAGDLYGKINAQRGVLFNEDQVIDWFVQICFSIKYIHDRKILHRDIKSQNIFLTKSGTIKLGDFGIAKVLNSTVELARTCIGTPYYLSPEICENRPYNNKSDIWSLGCVLYEMTTLKHAFEAGNMKNLVFKIVRGSYPPVSAKYSYELRNVIAGLFKRNPRDRPSINNLLRKNFLIKKVERYMGNEVIAKELAHTVMHGQKMAKDVRALPPAPAPVSRPVSARNAPEKRPVSARPTPRYDPAAVYGVPSARKSRESAARKSSDSARKSAEADKKRAAIAAVAAANNDIAKKRRELVEKEKARRVQHNDNDFAAQHKAIMDKQKVARIKKAREEGWKNLVDSLSSNEEEKSSSDQSRPKTPQQAVKRNIPSPKPAGGPPPKVLGNDRGQYDHYLDYLDKMNDQRGDRQRGGPPQRNYMDAGVVPQAAARQGNQDQKLGARAAEKARVVEEYMNRKKEAAFNKARGQAQPYGGKRPVSANKGGAGDAKPKKEWAEIDAKNEAEKEYLAKLKQIRLQNFNDRRIVKNVGPDKQGAGVKGALNADADIRKKKIEALKAQADERAKKLREQLEQKRRDAYEKERYNLERNRDFEQKPLFPVEPPKRVEAAPAISVTQAMAAIGAKKDVVKSDERVEAAPVIPMTQAMEAIGAKKEVESSIEKSPLQKKKDAILRRVNEKPRPKWGQGGEENVPNLGNLELEETASAMEVTSARDAVVKLSIDAKPKEERKKWGEPKQEERRKWGEPDPDDLPSARKQWGGLHESLINKLSEADIQATVTLPRKDEETSGVAGVGETIVITKQPPTPKAHGTITISKEDSQSKEDKDIDSTKLAPETGAPKAAGATITISDNKDTDPTKLAPETGAPKTAGATITISDKDMKEEGVKPKPRPRLRSRSPSPQMRPLPELKPKKDKSSGSDSDDALKVGDKQKKRTKSPLSCLKHISDKKTESEKANIPSAVDEVDEATKTDETLEETKKPELPAKPEILTKPALPKKPEIAAKPYIPAKPTVQAGATVTLGDEALPEVAVIEIDKPALPSKPIINAKTINLEVKKEIEEEDIERVERSKDGKTSPETIVVEESDESVQQSTESVDRPAEDLPPKEAWDMEPSAEKSTAKLKESLKKDSTAIKSEEKAPIEVDKSQGGKLFDKVELEEEEGKGVDDMKVEEYEEEEEETGLGYHKTISGMKLGLTIGQFDLRDSKMLRTCSLPDLSKLFKTIEEPEPAHVRHSLDLPRSPSSQEGDAEEGEEGLEEVAEEDEGSEEHSDDDDVDDDEDEDLTNIMATMESILLERQDSQVEHDIEELDDLKGSGSDSGNEIETSESDRDSATTTGDSSIINTIVPGQEEWCSDDDDDDYDRQQEEEDMFCRLEESRAALEAELGCDRFLDVYKAVQAAHEDEDETIESGEKIALGILGDKGHLYNKILQLVMADGAYIEDND